MTEVVIKPMPRSYLKFSMKYRPVAGPIFLDCGPGGATDEDRELARELFKALDPESQAWWKYNHPTLFEGL